MPRPRLAEPFKPMPVSVEHFPCVVEIDNQRFTSMLTFNNEIIPRKIYGKHFINWPARRLEPEEYFKQKTFEEREAIAKSKRSEYSDD